MWKDQDLIESFSVLIAFRCPCGSKTIHQVGFLHETVDCRRCGRTLAVREMVYRRPSPRDQPMVEFSIGYVVTTTQLHAMKAAGSVQ